MSALAPDATPFSVRERFSEQGGGGSRVEASITRGALPPPELRLKHSIRGQVRPHDFRCLLREGAASQAGRAPVKQRVTR